MRKIMWATLVAGIGVAWAGQSVARTFEAFLTPKIDQIIYHHQAQKVRPPDVTEARHLEMVRAALLDDKRLDAEQCALYVRERLPSFHLQGLLAAGIEVDPDDYIPSLPGRHPLGFHLAVVPYDALPVLAANPAILKVVSIERRLLPQNNAGADMIGARTLMQSAICTARTGAGVRLAIADSGLDVDHPDIPAPIEAFDVTDGTSPAEWGTDVSNQVQNHGTHVCGTAVGTGASSNGRYRGMAPGVDFYFYKIADDVTASAFDWDVIEAIDRALGQGCDVFSMSYGRLVTFNDGSEPQSQAIDVAVAGGMTCLIAAGNSADDMMHCSVVVPAATASDPFDLDLRTAPLFPVTLEINLAWRDSVPGDSNLVLACTNLGDGEDLVKISYSTSLRNTEAQSWWLYTNVQEDSHKVYTLRLVNVAPSGVSPEVHVYLKKHMLSFVRTTFADPVVTTLVSEPAVADGAIAVGAWTHRISWIDYTGTAHEDTAEVWNSLASFSSRGPRIDGAIKPEICAPGSRTISLRGSDWGGEAVPDEFRIDDDGLDLDGSGPAHYAASRGTSMSTPMVAGIVALLLEEDPLLTPAEIKELLQATAIYADDPTGAFGYGPIDFLAAFQRIQQDVVWVDFGHVGGETGSYENPYNTLAEGMAAVPPNGRLRFKPGTTSETRTFTEPLSSVDSYQGSAVVGD